MSWARSKGAPRNFLAFAPPDHHPSLLCKEGLGEVDCASNFIFKPSNTPYKFFKISLFVFRIMCVALLYAWYRDLYPTLPPLTKGRNRLQAHRRSPLHVKPDTCHLILSSTLFRLAFTPEAIMRYNRAQ